MPDNLVNAYTAKFWDKKNKENGVKPKEDKFILLRRKVTVLEALHLQINSIPVNDRSTVQGLASFESNFITWAESRKAIMGFDKDQSPCFSDKLVGFTVLTDKLIRCVEEKLNDPSFRNEELKKLIKDSLPLIGLADDGKKTNHAPVGLAFSGGGIRSATFNLGLSQGLAQLGILPWVDYLSSISGGGYTAATLTSLTSTKSEFGPHWNNFPFNPGLKVFKKENDEPSSRIIPTVERGHNVQLQHMRNYGNFIIPRLGTATADTIGLVGNMITSFVYPLTIFLLAVFAISTFHYGVTALLAPSLLTNVNLLLSPSSEAQDQAKEVTLLEQGELEIVVRGNLADPDLPEIVLHQNEELELEVIARNNVVTEPQSYLELVYESMVIPNQVGSAGAKGWFALVLEFPKRNLESLYLQILFAGAILSFFGALLILVPFYLAFYVPEFTKGGSPEKKLGTLIAHSLYWVKEHGKQEELSPQAEQPVNLSNEYARIFLIRRWTVFIATSFMTFVIVYYRWMFSHSEFDQVYWVWLPFFITLGASIGLLVFRITPVPYESETIWSKASFRALFASLQGLNIYAILIVFTLTILILPHFYDPKPKLFSDLANNIGFAFPTTAALLTLLGNIMLNYATKRKQMAIQANTPTWTLKLFALSFSIQKILLSILVIVFNFSLFFVFQTKLDAYMTDYIGWGKFQIWIPFVFFAAAFICMCFLAWLIDFNYVSHHYFYRDRMVNAYLATHLGRNPKKDARYDGKLLLAQINPSGSTAPYHLINGAINLTSSADLRFKDRKSQHFLFSKYYCGSEVTGYVRTRDYREGKTKLSRAIAVSGAAASSSVGYVTFFAQAFIFTILNLRLGLWMTNPSKYGELEKKLDKDREKLKKKLESRYFERKSSWLPYLWDEILARIGERRNLVNISDGGHTGDNGALYPLFQRRCQIIFAGDASQDHGYKFADLFHVLLQVKADFNIDVDINVDGIRPNEKGESAFHCAVGIIKYPPSGYDNLDKEDCYLIYFKPNMTGNEPSALKEYRKQHEKGFPHVSTTDLFFNERQFEAYREIGWLSVAHTKEVLSKYYEKTIQNIDKTFSEKQQTLESLKEREVVKKKKETVDGLGKNHKFNAYKSGMFKDLREATTLLEDDGADGRE